MFNHVFSRKVLNTKIVEFGNTVDADESADIEFSSGSTEFVLKSLIFHQNAVYSSFLIYRFIWSFFWRFMSKYICYAKKWKYNI